MIEFDEDLQQLINEPELFVAETEREKFKEYVKNCSDYCNSIRDVGLQSFPYFSLNYELIEKQVNKFNNIDKYVDFLENLPLPIARETLYLNKYDDGTWQFMQDKVPGDR